MYENEQLQKELDRLNSGGDPGITPQEQRLGETLGLPSGDYIRRFEGDRAAYWFSQLPDGGWVSYDVGTAELYVEFERVPLKRWDEITAYLAEQLPGVDLLLWTEGSQGLFYHTFQEALESLFLEAGLA